MKIALHYILVICFALAAVNCIVTMDLTANKRATSADRFGSSENAIAEVSFIGDYMFANAHNFFGEKGSNDGALTIFKYDSASQKYRFLLNYTMGYSLTLPSVPSSNLKWWGSKFNGSTISQFLMFQLDANNQMVQQSLIDVDSYGSPRLFRVMSDDSMVIGMNDLLLTYTYNGTGWVQRRADFESTIFYSFPVSMVHLTNTHLLFWNGTSQFNIYKRNGLQWDFLDSHQVNETYGVLNGIDIGTLMVDEKTVVFFNPGGSDPRLGQDLGYGYILFMTKVNGVWQYQVILASDVGINQQFVKFGATFQILNSDTIVVGAPLYSNLATKRGVAGSETGSYGKAFIFQRNSDGVWSAKVKLEISTSVNAYFANGFGVNNNGDALVVSCEMDTSFVGSYHCLPYYFPKCIVDPINATCQDVVLNDCSSVNVTTLTLYTQNDVSCGAVDAQYQNVTFKDNKYQATVVLSRPLAASDFKCTATVTCPAPPSTTTPTKKTSGEARVMTASVMSLIIAVLMV